MASLKSATEMGYRARRVGYGQAARLLAVVLRHMNNEAFTPGITL